MDKVKRLTTYLDKVQANLKDSSGALKEFWEREFRKTNAKIQALSK